jgi:Transposase domain (DUF772)
MLVDRYPPEDIFARVPELADQTDPVLIQLDRLLEDDVLYQQAHADLARRYRLTPAHGRPSTPAEALLRLFVVQHLYAWSYAETVERVADSLVLRWSCAGPALVLRWFCAGSAGCTSSTCPARLPYCVGRRPSVRRHCTPALTVRCCWPKPRRSRAPASCASTARVCRAPSTIQLTAAS